MEFKQFKNQLQENFSKLTQDASHLFESGVDRDILWELYLDSFPEGTNEIFRERREYEDTACRHFVRHFGGTVVIKDNEVHTIWDFETGDDKFSYVNRAMSKFIKSGFVKDVYVTKIAKIGTDFNFENLDNGDVNKWHHLYVELPQKFVSRSSESEAEIKGQYRDTRNVFKRSLDELTQESVLTVLELIAQNSLYKGEEWKSVLNTFLHLKKKYDKLKSNKEKELFAWEQSVLAGAVVGRIRNHSMGTLLVDISNGVELDKAVTSYEKITAPSSYRRPKAIFTQKMLDDAKKTISELGYLDSLPRRHAVLDDITVNNILFSNRDASKRIGGGDVFADMASSIPTNPKKFSRIEEITIEDFIKNILPTTSELEVLFENKHASSAVSLIAPVNPESKTMFKWDNGFSLAYTGNMADSDVRENVKSAGGNVDGVLRFSIQWNDGKDHDGNDLDAHVIEPNGSRIYYGADVSYNTGGRLDIDIRNPEKGKVAVENIFWKDKYKLKEGVYLCLVENFSHRGGKGGFRAEIEADGQTYSFDYNQDIRHKEQVAVAEVHYSKKDGFKVVEKLPSSVSTKEVWGLKTNQFIPVSVVMYSPNYWDEQKGIGHRHVLFMLKDCVNPERSNGFFNEFLKPELDKHKRVFEALGAKMAVETTDDQLSGLGFSATKRNDLTVKVKGQTERVIKVLF